MAELMATRDAYGKALVKLGEIDPNIVVLDADLSSSTRTGKFAAKFPERFFNLGVAEQNMMGTAAGLATCGKTVFASSFAIFASGRDWEQIRNTICYSNLNVKIVSTHGGISVGEDGSSHQCIEDIALMRTLSNMTVIVPCDGIETEKAVMAVAKIKGPVYVRLGRAKVPVILDENYQFEIGKAKIIQDGKDISLIACGIMVGEAIKAAEILKGENISARVINLSTIKPIDEETIIRAAKETQALVTAEEHQVMGGMGSAVAEVVVKNCPVPMRMVGMQNRFGQSGTPEELMQEYGLTGQNIANQAIALLKIKNHSLK